MLDLVPESDLSFVITFPLYSCSHHFGTGPSYLIIDDILKTWKSILNKVRGSQFETKLCFHLDLDIAGSGPQESIT